MDRLTILSLTALLVVLFSIGAQAQPTPAAQREEPQAPQVSPVPGGHSDGASQAQPANGLSRHRVIVLRVDEVIAADTGLGVDDRLLPMGLRLQSLFNYTTYRLISHQVTRTECGRTAAFTLPGGWIVHVEPNAVRDDMIAMELILFQGARPMMTTDVRLRNHGMLIVGGPHYEQGMLIIPIGADAPELAMPSGPIPVDPRSTVPETTMPEIAPPPAAAPDAGAPSASAPGTDLPDDSPAPSAPNQ
jgi:hypothetical protein